MSKVAVLMAEGFEEGETLSIIDILRRANIETHSFYFNEKLVKGMHSIYIEADKPFSDEIKSYDLVILPGGRPGGDNLRNNPQVIGLLKEFNEKNKLIGAMCSGTTVLEEAKVINGKNVTGYKGYEEKLISGNFTGKLVEFDKNIITSQGPATGYPFAYKIVEILGADAEVLKERMLYNFAGGR